MPGKIPERGKKHPAAGKEKAGKQAGKAVLSCTERSTRQAKGKETSPRTAASAKQTASPARTAPEQWDGTLLSQLPAAARRIVIVGGGASGMAAALAAAWESEGAVQIVLLEKQARAGRKLLATGNGRCNLGHTPLSANNYVSGDPAALGAFLRCRGEGDPAVLWETLGLLCREEEGRIYPYSNQAFGVLDVLRDALQRYGILLCCGVTVQSARKQADGFLLQLTQTQPNGTAQPAAQPAVLLAADRLILACGGAAAPALGGSPDGFALAKGLGHSCTALLPGLVGLVGTWTDETGDPVRELGGVLHGVRAYAAVALLDAEKESVCLAADTGEIQFNENGISGIPVLQLSLRLPRAQRPVVTLDLLPQLTAAELEAFLLRRLDGAAAPNAETIFLGTIHKRLVQALCRCTGIALHDALTPDGAKRLARVAKALRFAVTGTAGWAGAQTTVGGVPLAEVTPEDCASRLCGGLYLTGELLDAAGECGGFNLDWAFSTGLRAGRGAVRSF